MKIAIVRGPSLNPWEMQNFEPLAVKHNVLAIGSTKPVYDIAQINLPIKKLICLGNILEIFPYGIPFLYKVLGDTQKLFGFEKAVLGFDVVHTAETANYYSLQAIKAKEKRLVRKVVVTVWENITSLGEDNPKREEIKREVCRKADLFLAVTKLAESTLVSEGVDSKKIRVIPPGVDLGKFKPKPVNIEVRKEYNIPESKKIVLFVGRLVKEKGVFNLLEALGSIKKKEDWLALFAGSGPEKEQLIKKSKTLGLNSQVKFIDPQQYDKMPQIFNLADILVLPSIKTDGWQEQYGMVLVEAMASGLAVITTKGAQEEVVGRAGVVLPENNPKLLAGALRRLLKDEEELERARSKGRRRAEDLFDAREVSKRIEKAYKEIL